MKKTNKKVKITATEMGSVPMGTIVAFVLSKDSIPYGWLPCDGSTIPDEFSAFKDALGGQDTTPNLTGRVPLGSGAPSNITQSDGSSPNFPDGTSWPLAYTGGECQNTLTETQMPSHQHFTWGESGGGNSSFGLSSSKGYKGSGDSDDNNYLYGSSFTGGNLSPETLIETNDATITASSKGTTAPHNNMPPYYTVNYIIFTGITN